MLSALRILTTVLLLTAGMGLARAELYMVSRADISGLSERVTERLYTGKQIEFNNRSLTPLNYTGDHPARQKFLSLVIGRTETEFTAYWTTRRYVGLGTPPEEVKDKSRMLNALGNRDNTVGYIEATPDEAIELRKRFNVLLIRTADTRPAESRTAQ
jgi:hypothetical protein